MTLLIVGNLGYHESTIVCPILEAFDRMGVQYRREGIQLAYFPPNVYDIRQEDWYTDPELFEGVDGVFFLDWWYPAAASMVYNWWSLGQSKPTMVGLFHGSARLEGDIMGEVPGADLLEDFLLDILDALIIPNEWLKSYLPASEKYHVVGLPINHIIDTMCPMRYPTRRVVYTSRWHADKGNDIFEQFAEVAHAAGIECIATGNGKSRHIRFVGWLNRQELFELAQGGGYVFGAARQETWGYAPLEMIGMGLHPLLRKQENYSQLAIPDYLCWQDFDKAVAIVTEKWELLEDDRAAFMEKNSDNGMMIAEIVKQQIYGG